MIKREDYIEKIRPFFNTDLIKVITGVRRCGKSVMLELVKSALIENGAKENQFIKLNFEELDNEELKNYKTLHRYLSNKISEITGSAYLLLDEIQEVKNWEKCVNSLRVKTKCDIYITGSNAKMLSSELSTLISGRYINFVVYPFSFAEYLRLNQKEQKRDNAMKYVYKSYFEKYIEFGGMPFLSMLNYQKEPCKQYLEDLFSTIVLKDIMKRRKINEVDLLNRVIAYAMGNIGKTLSANSISKYFKSEKRTLHPDTILNYLSYCREAFLLYKVSRKDTKDKKVLSVNEKYYIADHGLRQAANKNNTKDIELVLENIVYIELLRRGYFVTVGKIGEKEIDFIAEKDGGLEYFQVCYLLVNDETINREFGVFKKVGDNFPKYVISMDEFDMGREGIIHKNIIDWLTDK
jgi:predicted AAA+ superfamily ATPase